MTKKSFVKAVVADGQATFIITKNGQANGPAVFHNVYVESIQLTVFDLLNSYQCGNVQVSADKKTITVNVNRLGSVLLGVIQFITAANGTTVYLTVVGD